MFSGIPAFSDDAREILECFDFHTQIERLAKANLLYPVTEKFAGTISEVLAPSPPTEWSPMHDAVRRVWDAIVNSFRRRS